MPKGAVVCSFVVPAVPAAASVPSVTNPTLNGTMPVQNVASVAAPAASLKNLPQNRLKLGATVMTVDDVLRRARALAEVSNAFTVR